MLFCALGLIVVSLCGVYVSLSLTSYRDRLVNTLTFLWSAMVGVLLVWVTTTLH